MRIYARLEKIILMLRLRMYKCKYKSRLLIDENIKLRRGYEINIKGEGGQVQIGDNCLLGKASKIITQSDGRVSIGKNTSIRRESIVSAVDQVAIGDNVIISRNVVIVDNNHPTHPSDRLKLIASGFGSKLWGWEYSISSPIIINDNVWIGEGVRILKGVEIGKNSIVGACAVVTKDVLGNLIVGGNPAKVLKENINQFEEPSIDT